MRKEIRFEREGYPRWVNYNPSNKVLKVESATDDVVFYQEELVALRDFIDGIIKVPQAQCENGICKII